MIPARAAQPSTTGESDGSSSGPPSFDALLCDIDGVLYVDDAAVPGAVEAVQRLRERGVGLRFLTNTTTRPREAVAEKLTALGFDIEPGEILTAPLAAAAHLRRRGHRRCHLVVGDDIESDVGGGQACGLTGVLVGTGKYREEHVARSSVTPDLVVADIAELAARL